MASTFDAQPPTTTPEVGGMGHSRKRVEDARFIRGKGTYIEDINLPGQLWLDIVRSPYAHARIKSIDSSEALQVPGVAAVITGKDLEGYGLHWMPTLAGDKQAVLPVDTVLFQSQEVAAVIATDRYAAADGVAAVLVDYEPLPVIVDPYKALEPGAPVLREDREQKDNHIWHWESGDSAATDAALAASALRVKEHIYLPRIHVASIETCGMVADWDAVNGHLTLHMTSQAPHVIRTVVAIIAAAAGLPIPEHKIRVKTHDIGGGFGGKVPAYPGYILAAAASFLTGKPVKWIEDRSENLQADSFARDYHIDAELGVSEDGRITAVKAKTIADHGAYDAQAAPLKFPRRPVQRDHRFVRLSECLRRSRRGVHEQGARRRRLPLLVPRDRGGPRHRAARRHRRPRARRGSGRIPAPELHPAREVPVHLAHRLGVRLRQLRRGAAQGDGPHRLRGAPARAGREAGPRRAHGHRHLQLHRDRGERGRPTTSTSSGSR